MDMSPIPLSRRTKLIDRILMAIVAVDEQTLKKCAQADWSNMRHLGILYALNWLFEAGVLSLFLHKLFASPGEISPTLIAVSVFISTFLMAIEAYLVMRSGWHLNGIDELKRGGIAVGNTVSARMKAGLFLVIRVAHAAAFAILIGLILSLFIFAKDIHARQQAGFVRANAAITEIVEGQVDGRIATERTAEKAQSEHVAALANQMTSLRQNIVDPTLSDPEVAEAQKEIDQLLGQKAAASDAAERAETFAANEKGGIKDAPQNSGRPGAGPRFKAAVEEVENAHRRQRRIEDALNAARTRFDDLRTKSAASGETAKQTSQQNIGEFEGNLAKERQTLAEMQDRLANLTRERDNDVRAGVESAPDYVPLNDGLLADIQTLDEIANGSPRIALVILLFEIVSIGFELGALLSKITAFVPTTYSALLAKGAFLSAVRLADEVAAQLDKSAVSKPSEFDFMPNVPRGNDNGFDLSGAEQAPSFDVGQAPPPPPPSPKRKRGRPRKIIPLN